MVVLTSNGETILKFLVTCNMEKKGIPRSIVCALLELLANKPSICDLAYFIYNIALRDTKSVIPLSVLTSSITRWPYIQHTYTIDVVNMTFQHHELAGPYYEPMKIADFLSHVGEETNTINPMTHAITEASGNEYVRFVGRRGQTHFCIRTNNWFELCKDKVIEHSQKDDCNLAREMLEYTFAAIPSSHIIPLSEYKSKHLDMCNVMDAEGDSVFHTISYFTPESPCWMKKVSYVGIYSEFKDDPPRMFTAHRSSTRMEYHEECDVNHKFSNRLVVNKHIKVLSYKRSKGDDRCIVKDQVGVHLFSTTDGRKMFLFQNGTYRGEFMDSKNHIQFEYI